MALGQIDKAVLYFSQIHTDTEAQLDSLQKCVLPYVIFKFFNLTELFIQILL